MANLLDDNEDFDDITDEVLEAFGGDPRNNWNVCISITRGFNMKFPTPVSFKDAVRLLESKDLGATPFPELQNEELLMYDVGFLMEGELDTSYKQKLN